MSKNQTFIFLFKSMLMVILLHSCSSISYRAEKVAAIDAKFEQEIAALYTDCQLTDILSYDIFQKAMLGHKYITVEKQNILTIIDYSQPSTARRCYVIDLEKREMLYHTLIAHGKNSGENYATLFSNIENSKQSSLGFFQTSDTYIGSNGYSMKLDGLEKNINHLARQREIVIHGADYVSQEFIEENGRLGRSWGCPAFPKDISSEIIDVIKGQSCVYIYADDPEYLAQSKYIPDGSALK